MNKSSASYKVLMNWSALISSSRSSSSCCAPMGSCGAGTTTTGVVLGVARLSPVIKRIWVFGHRHICPKESLRTAGSSSSYPGVEWEVQLSRSPKSRERFEPYASPVPSVYCALLDLKDFTFGNILQLAVHDL